MPKYMVHVTRYLQYKEEVEASMEDIARVEVASAIDSGHSKPHNDEREFEVCDITEEEDEKREQLPVV